ncbi:MAG: FHA domain-containing protein [Thermoproteota archaeon]
MRFKNSLLIFLLLTFAFLLLIRGDPYDVVAGFNTRSISTDAESFTLRLIIFTGSNLTYAGEFNVSYVLRYINLTKIESGSGWVLIQMNSPKKYVFYRDPSAASLPDRTTLATLTFRRGALSETETTNILLTLFKAADSSGSDLNIQLVNSTVTISLIYEETSGSSGGGGVRPAGGAVGVSSFTWLLVFSIALASVIVLSALYLKMGKMPNCFLVIDGRPLPIPSRGKVFGREDFYGLVSEDKLSYITRRSKGGHFTIVRFTDGYYIIDSYSTNGTLVDGVDIRGKGYVPLRNGARISIPQVFEATIWIRK